MEKLLFFLLHLGILLSIGYLIGYERQKAEKSIGIRTTTLILLGTYIFAYMGVELGDTQRMLTGIAGAIGFIGSGLIWKGDQSISNITTAVLILVLAGISCLVALHAYIQVAILTLLTIIILHYYKSNHK